MKELSYRRQQMKRALVEQSILIDRTNIVLIFLALDLELDD